jgi:hypothetical protein
MDKNHDPDPGKFFDADPGYLLMRILDPVWKNFGSGMEKFRVRDGKKSDPRWKKIGSKMEKNRIRDKHPGSATLLKMAFKNSICDVAG